MIPGLFKQPPNQDNYKCMQWNNYKKAALLLSRL